MNYIEDGTGQGFKAKVTDKFRLKVDSRAEAAEESAAVDGNAFIISARCRTAGATSGVFMHITNNDPLNDIHVTRIYIYPQTLTDADLICAQRFDSTVSGGTTLDSAIVNKNRGSSNAFDLTVVVSDASADATATGGTTYHEIPLNSRQTSSRGMNGTNIIPAGKSISFEWFLEDGSIAVDDQEVFFAINITKEQK